MAAPKPTPRALIYRFEGGIVDNGAVNPDAIESLRRWRSHQTIEAIGIIARLSEGTVQGTLAEFAPEFRPDALSTSTSPYWNELDFYREITSDMAVPASALVTIETSTAGLRMAKNLGIYTIGLKSHSDALTLHQLSQAGAHRLAASYADVDHLINDMVAPKAEVHDLTPKRT